MKKIRGDKPIEVLINIYMGRPQVSHISQGNSLCSYLYRKQAKMSCFSFLSFLFFLLHNQRTGGQRGPAQGGGGGWYQWEEGGGRERG
jgi:hypothetical protein